MERGFLDIRRMGALEIGRRIKKREISSPEATRAYLDAIRDEGGATNAYISVLEDAPQQAEAAQRRIDAGGLSDSPLAGVPVAVKDVICVKGGRTTAASRMLEGFRPPYDAHVTERLRGIGAVIIGKTNLDEFAMGGSTETSYFGATRNPWDLERVPGGSSGGSAAAVAAELAPYSIGSDTGGSIRQPCSFCSLTGIKPTYGSVSRYGLMAYASSLDQIGPMARDARDCAAALSAISGRDARDSTSIMEGPFDFTSLLEEGAQAPPGGGADRPLEGLVAALPENYFRMGVSDEVKAAVLKAARDMEGLGARVEETELPLIEYAVPAYYIIACAEASSNLSRYDGVKYGYRSESASDISEIFYRSRSEGFGTEVRRRIMLGSFVLSSGYFDAYYKKALQARGLIKAAFDEAFRSCDLIISPVSPTPPYRLGERVSDPLAMYMADVYTVSLNLTGLPGIALPCGFDSGGLPVGMQFTGKAFSEGTLIRAALAWQQATDYHKRRPAACEGRPAAGPERGRP
ncbi:MAG: Asp-tRNA(Asn)/Glu-tRNA(Gln) amidotransferase subunit GatA [Clostridiales Family XIII bacterium]|jgi:aspartyl-tRNA(Asn)/glutamyl-tRNA(Gln) amidotransferase subunit A|nr:Asp-tRNA(Asn)/Glu-tRNA(Gln) amidotransferase subunit GatA [Clostridiales Family XIII bacterium]